MGKVAAGDPSRLLASAAAGDEVEMLVAAQPRADAIDPATGIAWLDLQAALERLAPQDRELLVLRYVAGFDATELSRAVGLKPGGVRTRLKRLLDALRQELSDG
jgi:RNA polymerase sigma-70 factor (ECF subfamily)